MVSPPMVARDLRDVHTAAPDLDLIVATGDLTNRGDVPSLRALRRTLARSSTPVVPVFGGHDGNHERIELGSDRCIDPTLFRFPDGRWRMWYKDEGHGSKTLAVESTDLETWTPIEDPGVSELYGEAPKVFRFGEAYWMLKDPDSGLDVYRSDDLSEWEYQAKILDQPGRRVDDRTIGKHADVVVCGERAFIFYFTHPDGQDFPLRDGVMPYAARRSSIQAAELFVRDGKLKCNRDASRGPIRLTPPGS